MTLHRRFVGVSILTLVAAGCQGSRFQSTSVSPGTSAPGPITRRSTAPPPPPVMYSLCSQNLPTDGQWKGDPVLQDINGDGAIDLAAQPRLGHGPHIWFGDGRGGWTEAFSGWAQHENSCGGGLVFTDVNGDGELDMTIADHCRGVFVYLGNGEGDWDLVTKNLHPADRTSNDMESNMFLGAEDMDVGDVNGDGFPDLIVSASDESGINIYVGDGTGRNWTRVDSELPSKGWANRVLVRDMNRDGHLDVVAAYCDGPRVWHGDGKGNWTEAFEGLPSPVIRGLYTGIAVADLNEDGRLDIATANWVDGPEVYFQQEDGSWSKAPDVFPNMMGGSIGLALGDLDQDGHIDIVVSGQLRNDPGYVRGVFALKGDGKGNWTPIQRNGLPETGLMTTMGVALGDVNSDGLPDIVAGSGMTVERVPDGPKGPSVEPHLIMWCSHVPAREASLTKARGGY